VRKGKREERGKEEGEGESEKSELLKGDEPNVHSS